MTASPVSPAIQVRRRERRELAGAEEHCADLSVPADLPCFGGHFPGDPLLPAVVQLHDIVLRLAGEAWPDLGGPRRLLRLKFRQPIRPGDEIHLVLTRRHGERRLAFEIRRRGAACSSGRIEFEAPEPRLP